MLFTRYNVEDALDVRGEEMYEEGPEKGIKALIEACMSFSASQFDTLNRLMEKLSLPKEQAGSALLRYWKE